MRIAIASSGLGHVSRGIEAWATDLWRALRERGCDVRLYKGGGREMSDDERTVPCCRRAAASTERLLRWMPRRGSWRLGLGSPYAVEQTTFALSLLPQLRRDRVTLLHVQDPLVARIVQRAGRLGLTSARVILGHGTEEPPDFLRRLDYVQHLAPWHLEQSRRQGVDRPGWTAIPNFIASETFCPGRHEHLRRELDIPPQATVVLTAAAIKRHHKRIHHLLDQFARLNREAASTAWLVVAGGREPDTDSLLRAGQAALGNRVRFLVDFPRTRMPDLYRCADLFVLCSLYEMMPIALLEAAASGLPCVVHQHPVLQWMAGAGGLTVDMASPRALTDALGQLIQSPDGRRRLGAAARRHCLDHFSEDVVVKQIVDYYRQVLGSPVCPARAA